MIVQNLKATNDARGNPRRLWIISNDDGDVVKVIDEGYGGRPSECDPRQLSTAVRERVVTLWTVNITTAEYDGWKAFAEDLNILA